MTRRRRLIAALLLPGGLLVSHSAAYGLAGADPRGIGHGGPLHGDTTLLVVLAAVAALLAGALGSRSTGPRRCAGLLGRVGIALAATYAVMEVGERAAHGIPVADAVREPTLWYGFVVQLVVTAVAILIVWVGRQIAARARARLRPETRPVPPASPLPRWVPLPLWPSGVSRRGPPLQFVA